MTFRNLARASGARGHATIVSTSKKNRTGLVGSGRRNRIGPWSARSGHFASGALLVLHVLQDRGDLVQGY
jgi:hypothetical protein